jgi:hypothetical protein
MVADSLATFNSRASVPASRALTVNIAGRQYLKHESLAEFRHRAIAGEFAKKQKVPKQKLMGLFI